jgi:glycosyltransferase involved in cell wall biosynthesis
MNVFLENVNLNSTSGPNSFASKLKKYLENTDCSFDKNIENSDIRLCFIESHVVDCSIPMIQRLDGIYFNKQQDYDKQNENIKRTYELSNGVVFQSNFNKDLVFKYFGPHDNYKIIHNGADVDLINKIAPMHHPILSKYDNMWSCAAAWRPHKRLQDNINYFLQHKGENDCLVVAGETNIKNELPDVFYTGKIAPPQLISLYKASKYFLHLAWLDHCPNVVVDARASGCKIICSSSGGTKEIAGPDAVIIEEEGWNFDPVELYSPPAINFDKKIKNSYDIDYNMSIVANKYKKFLGQLINEGLHSKSK